MKIFHFLPLLLLFIFSLIFFREIIFNQKLPVPSDAVVALYHPYRDFFSGEFPRGYPYKNFLITDPLLQQYPWREISISSLKQLSLPLWNPYNGAGEPLLANIQSGSLYPLNFIFFLFPFTFGWTILIMLQPLLAGLFLFFYLRYNKLSLFPSILGALSFSLSGFSVAWMEWGTIMHTGLWLPLVLLSIDKLFEVSKKVSKKKNIVVWSSVYIFSLITSLFAGHLQTFVYVYCLQLVYIIMQLVRQRKLLSRYIIVFGLLNLLFVILSSIQSLPTLQLILASARDIDQLWHKDGWFIPYEHLVQFFVPDFFGNPTTLNYWGTWNYGEMIGYIGLVPLIFVIYSVLFIRRKKILFFGVVAFISLLFALPTPLSQLPFMLKIPFLSTAQPTRLLFIVDFCLCILASYGLDSYMNHTQKRKILLPLGLIFLVMCALWAFVILNISDNPHLLIAKQNLYLPTAILCTSIFLFFAYSQNKLGKYKNLILISLILLSFGDLYRFSQKFLPFTQNSLLYPQTKTTSFLQKNTNIYPWRFLGVDYVGNQKRIFPPNFSSHYKLYTIDTYNPLLLKRFQEFAVISEWGFADVPQLSLNRTALINNYESPFINFLGIKYIVSINDIFLPSLKLVSKEGDSRIYENKNVFPRAYLVHDVKIIKNKQDIAKFLLSKSTDLRNTAVVEENLPQMLAGVFTGKKKVNINEYKENFVSFTVQTDRDGLLVFSDTYYPTWHSTIDGVETKIYRTNYNFRGVFVPRGTHTITMYPALL